MAKERQSVFLDYYSETSTPPAVPVSRVQGKLAAASKQRAPPPRSDGAPASANAAATPAPLNGRQRSNTLTKPERPHIDTKLSPPVPLTVAPVSPLSTSFNAKGKPADYFGLSATDPGRRADGLASPSPIPTRTPSLRPTVQDRSTPSPNSTPGPRAPVVTRSPSSTERLNPPDHRAMSQTPGSAGLIPSYGRPIDIATASTLPPPRAAFVMPPGSPTAMSPSSAEGSPVWGEKGGPMLPFGGSGVSSPESDSMAGPDNDRMRPAGEKVDFWRRFSMVAHEAEATSTKRSHSRWLSKETRGSKGFKYSIWLLAIVVLAAIGGGVGYSLTHKSTSEIKENPTVAGAPKPTLGFVGGSQSGQGGGRPNPDTTASPAAAGADDAAAERLRRRHLVLHHKRIR